MKIKPHSEGVRWWLLGLLALCLITAGFQFFWSRRAKRPQTVIAPVPGSIQSGFASTLPRVGGPPGYVTSASCRECHPREHESWHRSYHRSMTQLVSTNSVVADFDGVTLESSSERFTLSKQGGGFWVQIDDFQEQAERFAKGLPQESLHLRMGLVTGSHHMQVFWLPGGAGNVQVGFPFTWLIEDRRWVPRNDAFIRDPTVQPTKEVWNLTCIRCHTTAGQPRPDFERDIFDTQVAELGVACEACHGPAERHVEHQLALAKTGPAESRAAKEDAKDDTIVQPRDLDHIRSSQVCGSCHSIKWFDESEGWREHGFRYRPGDDLEKTTPVVRPKRVEHQPWLKNVLAKNPNLFEDFFWSDGMIRVAGREFNGLLESACFGRGEMSCLSCHSLHKSEPNDQLARGMEGNQACLQCHRAFRENLTAHTHHAPESSGSLCDNCHMPHTSYGLLKAIRSHQISSPTVASSLETGRPNACNMCHLDQTLDWTSRHLHAWFNQPTPELNGEQRTVAASLLWMLSGEAGQRALAAWTMGWGPAREASGQDWQAPHLAHLLNDPYSAVRYIAHRSLRQLPGFTDFNYDFVGPPQTRPKAEQEALERWSKLQSRPQAGNAHVFLKPDGTFDFVAAARLHQKRNDRPVRLRE